jgi:hypothetical protein
MNLKLWNEDAPEFERRLMADIDQLKDGSLFRFHISGDIPSADYARMIGRIVAAYPAIDFWLYTRSYRVAAILPEIERLETDYPNLKVWRSTDSSVEPQPLARDARAFETAIEAKAAGYTVCPEQTGAKESCEDCGLCFKISKPTFKLAFVKH